MNLLKYKYDRRSTKDILYNELDKLYKERTDFSALSTEAILISTKVNAILYVLNILKENEHAT